MSAGGGDLRLHVERALTLPGRQADVAKTEQQSQQRRTPGLPTHGKHQPDEEDQRQQGADGGDPVPGHAHRRERPKQMRPVVGTGVEHPMRCIAKGASHEERPPVGAMALLQQPRRGSEDAANRNEGQRVREVAVVLDRQQGIGRAPDQDVDIRQHTAEAADQPRLAPQTRAKGSLRSRRTEQCMSQWIHSNSSHRLGAHRGCRDRPAAGNLLACYSLTCGSQITAARQPRPRRHYRLKPPRPAA
jgi:hypothetical protein